MVLTVALWQVRGLVPASRAGGSAGSGGSGGL